MKLSLILLLAVASSLASAGEGTPCDKLDYAKLKDSSRKELTDNYCTAMLKEKLNENLGAIQKNLFESQLSRGARTEATQKAMIELGDARVTCLKAAEEASSMLQKKFKAARPSCAGYGSSQQ